MPKVSPRKLPSMTIGALSRAAECTPETIRYYERIGLLPAPPRSGGGHRMYAMSDAKRLVFVRRARELGFGLNEVRDLLNLAEDGAGGCAEVRQMALTHVGRIRRRIRTLGRLARELERAAELCTQDGAQGCAIVEALYPKGEPGADGRVRR